MTIENADYIHQLDSTAPRPVDPISEGDNHIRLIKKLLTDSFPSDLDGVIVPDVTNNEDKFLRINSDATGIEWVDLNVAYLTRRKGEMERPWFEYVNQTKFKVHPGVYDLSSKGTYVSWDTPLEHSISGSNGWRYLYLNEDSISGNTVSASNLMESGTAPVYNNVKHGWYKDEDRCIFTYHVSGELTPFYNDGSSYVEFRNNFDHGQVTSTSTINVNIPPLGSNGGREVFGEFTFRMEAPPGGTSGTTFSVSALEGSGHFLARVESDGGSQDNQHVTSNNRIAVYKANSSTMQIHLIKSGGAAINRCWVYTNGYYLPRGM
jgi:hypothetical protein